MKKFGKWIAVVIAVLTVGLIFTSCNKKDDKKGTFDNTAQIAIQTREDGSGTRGAFIELVGLEVKENDKKVDKTTPSASITNSTGVMLTTVAGNPAAIGYISLGSLNDTVKALKVDGVAPSKETVKDGSYKVARPFNIATKGEATGVTKDFINFILSKEGQKIVEDNGYVAVAGTESFKTDNSAGTIKISGSSSVTPVMEKLIEEYTKANPKATIELNQSDSSSGMKDAINGVSQIGMASRELKDSEKAELTPTVIAKDGIAVIVHKSNTTDDLSTEQIKNIYLGQVATWADATK
ncbi:MAG: substrate-binding domain-containing protein [Clostridia bacterium]|nr:substrate-binding domain-containing protein [Clostridia bacterium]